MRAILMSALVCAIACAQATDSQLAFEVATIKPSTSAGMGPVRVGTRGGPGTADPARFTCERCTLATLISTAYGINYVQIAGPSWLREPEFDIAAKIPEGATKAQFREMMQNLLIERFKLAAHQEKRDLPIYEMSVVKKGARLKASTGPADLPDPAGRGVAGPPRPPPPPPGSPGGRGSDGVPQAPPFPPGRFPMMMKTPAGARWRVIDETMDEFASHLQGMVGRPVRNATGLTGKYDFELSFAPSAGQSLMPGGPPMRLPPPGTPDVAGAAPEDSGETIFAAVQDQLGLKLESKRGPVDTLMIDHIERTPTEN
jgi:uncharacterized protein (TIGR03435 family)